MFDMGFTEMMLIGIVALVVIGPERLPGVARTAGKYFSKLRSFVTSVRADVESELRADELREMFEAQQQEIKSLKEVVGDAGKDIGLTDIADEMTEVANSIGDTTPISEPQPETETKTATMDKPAARPAAKKKSVARSGAKSKSKSKLKPKAGTKTKSGAKARVKPKTDAISKSKAGSDWTGALEPPAVTTETSKVKTAKVVKETKTVKKAAKPAKVKAK
jgi:sec-independent protein translocase protein TatB